MQPTTRLAGMLAALLVCAAAFAGPRAVGDLPPYVVADPTAPPVTAETIATLDRFWPYRVTLEKRDLRSGVPVGSVGALVRVEGRSARVDFGRDGVHDVPVEVTNLLAEANRLRTGELTKTAANFVMTVGPRLTKGGRQLRLTEVLDYRGYLAVFADPRSDQFDDVARSLAPLVDHPGVLTVLFPQSNVDQKQLDAKMATLGWPAANVFDFLVAGYTESLLSNGTTPPAVLLVTKEGRLVFESKWSPVVGVPLTGALDTEFPSEAAQTANR